MIYKRFRQCTLLLIMTLLMFTLAGCQTMGWSQESATWDEQYGAAHQAAVDIDPNVALHEVRTYAEHSEAIYEFIRPSGELIRITFPSPDSTSISGVDQSASIHPPPSQQKLDDLRHEVSDIQISLAEAYHLTVREKAWLAAQSQVPVTQRAHLNGGNALWWSIRYESGDIASPDYLSLLIRVDVQTGEFRRCIFLKGEEGEERSEQCPEGDEVTPE